MGNLQRKPGLVNNNSVLSATLGEREEMKRIDTMTDEGKNAFIRSILEARKNFTSSFQCGTMKCYDCPLIGSFVGCNDQISADSWCAWAEEEVKNETDI